MTTFATTVASALTNEALAYRLDMLAEDVRAFPAAQRAAFLVEAARRLTPPTLLSDDEREDFRQRNGYLITMQAESGLVASLVATVVGGGQIVIGGPEGVTGRYSYADLGDALIAFMRWDTEHRLAGEPEGWIRHQPSNRRRVGGDPDQEYVQP